MIGLFINILLIFYFFFISRNLFKKSELTSWYYPLLLLKFFFGISYALIYTYYYQEDNDSMCYHHDGQMFSWYFWHEPYRYFSIVFKDLYECETQIKEFWMGGLDRSFFMSKFISLLYIIFSENYWIITLYSAMINFWAVYYFANQLIDRYSNLKYAFIIAFFCFPSVQIWTSGLLKETYGVASMFFLLGLYLDDSKHWFVKCVLGSLCIFFIYNVKSYYLIVFPFIILHYMYTHFNKWLVSVISLIGIFLIFVGFQEVIRGVVVQMLYSHDVGYYVSNDYNSNNEFGDLTTNYWALLKNAPLIVYKACFAPNNLVGITLLKWVESISNIMVLSAVMVSITMAWLYKYRISMEVWILLGFVIAASFVIGMTVPNLGSLVRIRVFYEPFLVLLGLIVPIKCLQDVLKR